MADAGVAAGLGLSSSDFGGGVQGYFASQKITDGGVGRFEIALHGSKGIAMFHIDQNPVIYFLADPQWSPGKTGAAWRALPGCPGNDDRATARRGGGSRVP
jgi:hypothetical protein